MQLCGQIDDMNAGEQQLHPIDEDGPMESSVVVGGCCCN